jgi:hypothetical protein
MNSEFPEQLLAFQPRICSDASLVPEHRACSTCRKATGYRTHSRGDACHKAAGCEQPLVRTTRKNPR